MAEALISVLLEQLSSITYEYMRAKVRLILDVEKDVAEFTSNLKAIQAVLKDAEKRQVKEAVVQDWLDKLKQVSYEMDNVLDEWNTESLKQQVEKQENEGENTLVNKGKKVRFFIPSPCKCFGFGQGVFVHHAIAMKIKELNSRLTSIAEERQRYRFQSTTISGIEQPERPKSSSLVDVSKVFGREDEKRTLISMLLGKSSGNEKLGPLVICIIGMGGIGKTTLAQLAFNNEVVKAHFQNRKWVCVSDPFDVIKIAEAIIDKDHAPTSDELDGFMQSVSESVEGKRFLLVLDDVWTEDDTKWEPLRLALMSGAEGSRILVTTRNKAVARMMGATTQIIHLEKLSDQHCFSLFYHLAFLNREKDKSDLFEAIGKEIVKKCKGSPLAAKTLGSLMWNKKTTKEWCAVLESEMWDLEEVEKKVFQPLLLSYYDLASEIKRCLLFCACFPQDYRFYKDTLIELWMSQNYFTSKRNKEKRTIGQDYFDNLVTRCFFQDFELDDKGNIKSCKMHDIVHEFVKFLARNESLIIEADGANRSTELSTDKVCHLSLVSVEGRISVPISFHKCTNLRTLTTYNSGITTIGGDLVLQLKCLRTLNLSDSEVHELPKEIGELLHLRYIDLSHNNSLEELPDAMCNLFNLETLHIEYCGSLTKLPKAMGKLINLKHLYVAGCRRLEYLPKGIGRIRGLRILDTYTVVCGGGDDDGNEILRLGDLAIFDQLQGKIVIRDLGKVIDASEAQKAQLEKKKHLLDLVLDFELGEDSEEERRRKSDVEVLNALQPHQNLEYLEISDYAGTTVSPKWLMSLHHLRFLTLDGCHNCESLPPLGRLQSLEVLEIVGMRVEKVGIDFLGIEETQTSPVTAFPKLEKLSLLTKGWKEWEGVRGCMQLMQEDCQVAIMPHLSDLRIESESLKQLPDFLQNRPHLDLTWIPIDRERKSVEKRAVLWAICAHARNIRAARLFVEGGITQAENATS
ncbi:putative P-loop containing nucleoside triphosphate hydrolase, leucine-rich repeat domain, L [Rosa chinensis]|uniref:Putative P-loop containing nucleoside triphosphate hydrolase, leucine-rich repeat domain, L n=1 Tax=Rosa chinensis TaxID=74649 RepID=A0A2P6RX80_ROSCH|nr:putative disease resistance protein RGA3 [Rosa chinensis]PRQ51031.1 putative P-loop containing nucleoside triphosphate hydrolase, leucine-rich repeat domain, L [Rosa chinensis]